jgi:hypothetical protein
MSSQPPTFANVQSWWGRTFRIGLRVVFVIWIVIGVLGVLMSIIKPLGMIPFGLLAIVGGLGLRATRPPFHEWQIVSALGFDVPAKGSLPDKSTTSTSSADTSSAAGGPPRPNKSLERTREG